MTRTKARECGTKVRHPSRSHALEHLHQLLNKGASPALMHVYRCRGCLSWHVGHRRGRRKR